MKALSPFVLLTALAATTLAGQQPGQTPSPMVQQDATVKVAPHVYVIPDRNIPGVPNIGIIVGSKATLLVDTGLGGRNGEIVLREAERLRRGNQIYAVATHFHSEHALGETGLPASATVIRARAQQRDMDEFGVWPNFTSRSPEFAELMQNAAYRPADEIFDAERTLDLGDVRARIFWYGGTHTNGDTMIFVEEDGVLFAGDVVMNGRFLAFVSRASSVRAWLDSLGKLATLRPTHIVTAHGKMGDGSLIDVNRSFLVDLQRRALALKRDGKTMDEAVETISAELRAKHPDWTGNPAGAAQSAYREAE